LLEKVNLRNKSKQHQFINAEECDSFFFHGIPFHFQKEIFQETAIDLEDFQLR
jgi:hypothetical protein